MSRDYTDLRRAVLPRGPFGVQRDANVLVHHETLGALLDERDALARQREALVEALEVVRHQLRYGDMESPPDGMTEMQWLVQRVDQALALAAQEPTP